MRTNHRNELGYSLGRLKIACGWGCLGLGSENYGW
jgi:hypothetical protein